MPMPTRVIARTAKRISIPRSRRRRSGEKEGVADPFLLGLIFDILIQIVFWWAFPLVTGFMVLCVIALAFYFLHAAG